jgi:hypothetical protein
MTHTSDLLVTPSIRIGCATGCDSMTLSHEDSKQWRLTAIQTIREMDADKLKELVLVGLIDADAYPFDFTEWES